jgi:hypothetical protein
MRRLVKETNENLGAEIDTRQKETRDLRERQLELEKDAILMFKNRKKYRPLIGVMIGIALSLAAGLIVYVIPRSL